MFWKKLGLIILLISSVFNLTFSTNFSTVELQKIEQDSWKDYISRFKERDFKSQANYDIKFYHIDIDVSIDTEYLKGSVVTKFEITEDETDKIKLDLHHSLSVDSITGDASSFVADNDTIIVTLDQISHEGDNREIKIYYQGVPEILTSGYSQKGFFYSQATSTSPSIGNLSTPFLAHMWYPCKDGPSDKADSVYIDITIPDLEYGGIPLIAVSNGLHEGTTDKIVDGNSYKTFHWRERYPIVSYYVMIAIAPYLKIEDQYSHNGVSFPLEYYCFQNHYQTALDGVALVPNMISILSDLFGEYPFKNEKYGMTQVAYMGGGIEKQTNSVMGSMNESSEDIILHELAHMWFGDMITCESWHHGWLNEGFASYAEALYFEQNDGYEEYKNRIKNCAWRYGGTLYLEDDSDPFNIFVGIIYTKGAYLLHMLRGVLGDETFFETIKTYATDPQFRYGYATTEDFQEICELVSGKDLTTFFEQWVYDENYPKYGYNFDQVVGNGGNIESTTFTIAQTQSELGWRAVFEMPVEVKFNFSDGTDSLYTFINNQQYQTYTLNFDKIITDIEFDPNNWLLRDTEIPASINENGGTIVENFSLLQNYPNPFNPTTTICFNNPDIKLNSLSLQIFNNKGEMIESISLSNLKHGLNSIKIDMSNHASGVFFYRLEGANFNEMRKMVLCR